MKYLEELVPGEAFTYKKQNYILTTDYKKNLDRLCINLSNGLGAWLASSTIVDKEPVYFIDNNNEIIPLRKTIKDEKNTKIS